MGEPPDPDPSRWPGGQTARYLTAGGATVDVVPGEGESFTLTCLGCKHSEIIERYIDSRDEARALNERVARARAETHADRCREIAPPTE